MSTAALFPSQATYQAVVKNLDAYVQDRTLKGGKARKMAGTMFVEMYVGGFSLVFPIQVKRRTWALRCWTAAIGDSEHRYAAISEFIANHPADFFVDFTYVKEGLKINEQAFPIIRMEWVQGDTLHQFILDHHHDPHALRQAAEKFAAMVAQLHQLGISHGDLQPENIMVEAVGNDFRLRLIDYDSFYVPGMQNPDNIVGQPAFQHPTRIESGCDGHPGSSGPARDYFSELVIYLSLLALADDPSLMENDQDAGEKKLIFDAPDFRDPGNTPVWGKMTQLSSRAQHLAHQLMMYCQDLEMANQMPLEALPQPQPPRREIENPFNLPQKENWWTRAKKGYASWKQNHPFFDVDRSPIFNGLKRAFGSTNKPASNTTQNLDPPPPQPNPVPPEPTPTLPQPSPAPPPQPDPTPQPNPQPPVTRIAYPFFQAPDLSPQPPTSVNTQSQPDPSPQPTNHPKPTVKPYLFTKDPAAETASNPPVSPQPMTVRKYPFAQQRSE